MFAVSDTDQQRQPESKCARAPNVLLIDGQRDDVDFVQRGLEAEGFAVSAENDGRRGEERAVREHIDVVVLDLTLPDRDGLAVLTSLGQAKQGMPVIVLTGRGEVEDRVAALDAGAVDYLVKPCSVIELAARIRAQLRRRALAAPTELNGEGITLDLLTRRATVSGGKPVNLSRTEFELLAHLMRNRERVISHEELLSVVWHCEHDVGSNRVAVYIGYLRRKLSSSVGCAPIYTVPGAGYGFGRPES